MITSVKNPKIQLVRALLGRPKERREAGSFVVEGVRLAEEALASGWGAQLVLHSPDLSERGWAVVAGFAGQGAPVEEAAPEVLQAASDTQNPQGLLAVLPLRSQPLPENLDFVFIPTGVHDPGNLGTMLRSAAAAGAGGVFLPEGTADAYAPKVVRAAMGAHFRLPLVTAAWPEIEARLERGRLKVYLADSGEGTLYSRANFRPPVALMIGGEAEGAGEAAARLAHECVHIPMPGRMESLNAAVAAGILLFEVVRQRNL